MVDSIRVRREPPRFRRVSVVRSERRTPRLVRITLAGPELDGLVVQQPASSVRLLVPAPGSAELSMPEWTGNEFLLRSGLRPYIRTFTPRRFDAGSLELDLEVVTHGAGVASEWAARATTGDKAAISGTARGYTIDAETPAPRYVLAGDETAIPAISQLLEAIPHAARVDVHIEAPPDAEVEMPVHPRATVRWHAPEHSEPPGSSFVRAVREETVEPDTKVWVAGEAAAVQRVRRHLFDERGLSRSQATVRGYWKHGRAGDDATDGE